MYTIGQVARMFRLPVSTLRYYNNQGLLPDLQRKSGNRMFSESDVECLRVIECLRASGMEIKDIRDYIGLWGKGSSTYAERKALFETRKTTVEKEIESLQRTLDLLKYECWYYDTAIADGNENRLHAMLPDKLPDTIQKLYDNGHKEK